MKLKKGARVVYIGKRKQSTALPVNGDEGIVISVGGGRNKEIDTDEVVVKWDRVGEFTTYKRYVTYPAAE